MIGKYPAKLDEKNRLFVPAKLRAELGSEFFVTLGVNCGRRCLTVYTAADWEQLGQNYNALPISQRSAATSLIILTSPGTGTVPLFCFPYPDSPGHTVPAVPGCCR